MGVAGVVPMWVGVVNMDMQIGKGLKQVFEPLVCDLDPVKIERFEPLHLVKMDQVPPRPFTNLQRNQDIAEAGGYTQLDWYAMYPHMYVGDASSATAEKGKVLLEGRASLLVDLIRAVKADDVTPELVAEFNIRQTKPSSPDFWTEG